MKTTLNKIRAHKPCGIRPNEDGTLSGLVKLMHALGKTKPDDEPITMIQILDLNGLDDAYWCLRAVDGYDKEIRLHMVWCAREVKHLMNKESLNAIDVAEKYAYGLASDDELAAARNAARAAARADAKDPARDAAGNAARNAVWDAARVAAWAAEATAWAAAGVAVWGAVLADARSKQEKELRRLCTEILEREELNNQPLTIGQL